MEAVLNATRDDPGLQEDRDAIEAWIEANVVDPEAALDLLEILTTRYEPTLVALVAGVAATYGSTPN